MSMADEECKSIILQQAQAQAQQAQAQGSSFQDLKIIVPHVEDAIDVESKVDAKAPLENKAQELVVPVFVSAHPSDELKTIIRNAEASVVRVYLTGIQWSNATAIVIYLFAFYSMDTTCADIISVTLISMILMAFNCIIFNCIKLELEGHYFDRLRDRSSNRFRSIMVVVHSSFVIASIVVFWTSNCDTTIDKIKYKYIMMLTYTVLGATLYSYGLRRVRKFIATL
jgi:hypothetical protein